MLPAKPWFPSSTGQWGLCRSSIRTPRKASSPEAMKNQEDCQQRRLSIVVDKDEAQELEQNPASSALALKPRCASMCAVDDPCRREARPNRMPIILYMPRATMICPRLTQSSTSSHVHNPDMKRFVIEDDQSSSVTPTLIWTPGLVARDVREEDSLSRRCRALAALVQNSERATCDPCALRMN